MIGSGGSHVITAAVFTAALVAALVAGIFSPGAGLAVIATGLVAAIAVDTFVASPKADAGRQGGTA